MTNFVHYNRTRAVNVEIDDVTKENMFRESWNRKKIKTQKGGNETLALILSNCWRKGRKDSGEKLNK